MRKLEQQPSRRAALATLASAAALAVTAAPVAAQAAHADQELLDLAPKYDAALQVENAAYEPLMALSDACQAARPPMPDALRHRVWDHSMWLFPISPLTRRISDLDNGDFYCVEEVDQLRAKPRTKRVAKVKECSKGVLTEVGPMMDVPHPEAQARADEIIAAWDEHRAACQAVTASFGFDDAEQAFYQLARTRVAIGDRIVALRATTIGGLRVRAKIVAHMFSEDDLEPEDEQSTDEKMMWAIVRDLVRIET
jgi:hypothetical protein